MPVLRLEIENCTGHNPQFNPYSILYHQIALVTPENRVARTADSLGDHELAQGRAWCLNKQDRAKLSSLKGGTSKLNKFIKAKAHSISISTLVFESDIVLVNRHIFVKKNGEPAFSPENCFFEHVASEEMIPFTAKAKYLPYNGAKVENDTSYHDFDLALVRLSRPPSDTNKTKAIPEKDILIEKKIMTGTPLIVASNYAHNAPRGEREMLTIANCMAMERIKSSSGGPSVQMNTNCNTGDGSSGSNIFVEEEGKKMFYGIVVSDLEHNKPGSGYDTNRLSTQVTRFTTEFKNLYDDLRKM